MSWKPDSWIASLMVDSAWVVAGLCSTAIMLAVTIRAFRFIVEL